MQPLISPVDHESRSNSYRTEDEPRTTEQTPLLQRFPRTSGQVGSRRTTFVVGLLLLILLSGVIIGVYLLVIQNKSENILPPIETPVRFFVGSQWNKKSVTSPRNLLSPSKIHQVTVVQTDTGPCSNMGTCTKLLKTMRTNNASSQRYNFLISSNGETLEDLGWSWRSDSFSENDFNAIVLAFIGNFTEQVPAPVQMQQAEAFLEEALNQHCLAPDFVIVGRRTQEFPKHLFLGPFGAEIRTWEHDRQNCCIFHRSLVSARSSQRSSEMPVPFSGRFSWGKTPEIQPITLVPLTKNTVQMDVVTTETSQCDGVEACTALLNTMQVVPRKNRQSGFKC